MAIELHGGKPLNPLVNAGAMATVSLVNGADADEIWANMMNNFNSFANTALTVNQKSTNRKAPPTSTTAASRGCWTATATSTTRRR